MAGDQHKRQQGEDADEERRQPTVTARATDGPTLRAGLEYLARGWSVMAVPESSKKRARPWKKCQRRRATPKRLRADFAAEAGRPNVAVICGRVSRLVVLDADGREAEERMRELVLLRTLSVRTARGAHWYFRSTSRLRSRVLSLSDGNHIELRGEGTYVLAPPSQHPSGLLYAFEDPEAPLAELPETILNLFTVLPSTEPMDGGPPPRWIRLVETYPAAKDVWTGKQDTPEGSASAKDMLLAHFARRHGFNPEEVTQIIRVAPYPVGGGRPESYLRRTVEKAFQTQGTRQQAREGYGAIWARAVTSRTWARLSPKAKAVYVVLAVRAMRPTGIVRAGVKKLAAEAGIHEDNVGPATNELVKAGLIRKKRGPTGCNYWVLPPAGISSPSDLTYTDKKSAQVSQEITPSAASAPQPPQNTPRSGQKVGTGQGDRSRQNIGTGPSGHEDGRRVGLRASPPDPSSPPEKGGQGVRGAAALPAPVRPSMRLEQELLPGGMKRVYRICADESRALVWEGNISEWLAWMPPDCLRYEDRMAEWPRVSNSAAASPVPGSGRCTALTTTRLECALRAVPGTAVCNRHQPARVRG